MIREAELDEMRQELKKASEIDLDKEFRNTIDPTGSLAESLKPPELPRFSDADLPAAPATTPESPPPAAIEGQANTSPTPATAASLHDAAADPLEGEPPLSNHSVTPTQAGVEGSGQETAAPGFPLSRE
jgi:sec-independent protein translocase protein TatB